MERETLFDNVLVGCERLPQPDLLAQMFNLRGQRLCRRRDLDARWRDGLQGLETVSHVVVLYWMDRARRDLVIQAPHHYPERRGTFALRSPVRPNPIASSMVELVAVEGTTVQVRGLDCLDGTPLVDLKPERTATDG